MEGSQTLPDCESIRREEYYLRALQGYAAVVNVLYDTALGGLPQSLDIPKSDVITPEHRAVLNHALDYHEKHFKYLELPMSLKYFKTLRAKLTEPECKYGEYEQEIDVLQGRVDHEMEDVIFGFIPAAHAPYFQNKELFGAKVNSNFSSAAKDIKDAGNCYANSNYTASVFHLMRTLEIALHVLAKSLNITFPAAIELGNWKNRIDKIDAAIKALEQLPKSAQKSEDLQFYSEAAKEFRYFKDAWRNHVAHSRQDYDVHDASKIMEHVKDFMQHLATRLQE